MIRRSILVGAALAPLLPPMALAQQATTAVTAATPDQVARLALGGMAFAMTSAELGSQKAENPAVRAFGQLESEEQMAFTQARSMAGLPTPSTAMMDPQKQQLLQQLRGLSGGEFDRAFVQGQMLGHQELLQLHMAMAQSAATREERMLGTVAVPAIRTHLVMLQGLRQQLGG